MATNRQTLTRDQWNARARALAKANGLVGKARYLGRNDLDARLYKVPSSSHPDGVSYHVVTLWKHDGAITCDCLAGCFGKPCGHAGAAQIERQAELRTEAKRAAAKDYRDYLRDNFPAPGFCG